MPSLFFWSRHIEAPPTIAFCEKSRHIASLVRYVILMVRRLAKKHSPYRLSNVSSGVEYSIVRVRFLMLLLFNDFLKDLLYESSHSLDLTDPGFAIGFQGFCKVSRLYVLT